MNELIRIVSLALKTRDAAKEIAQALTKGEQVDLDAFVRRHLAANARRRYERKLAVIRAAGGIP